MTQQSENRSRLPTSLFKSKVVDALIGVVAALVVSYAVSGSSWFADRARKEIGSITAASVLSSLEFEIQHVVVGEYVNSDGYAVQNVKCNDGYTLVSPICEWVWGSRIPSFRLTPV